MKKRLSAHIALLLLCLTLFTQVGVHLLHNHAENLHASESGVSITALEDEADCLFCDFDFFSTQDIEGLFEVAFASNIFEELSAFLLGQGKSNALFSLGRAPPVC